MSDYDEALTLIRSGEYSAAAHLLSNFDGASELDAWNEIAAQLYAGEKVTKNPTEAVRIWERLAKAGDAHSQNVLGSLLIRKEDSKSILEGIQWLEKAGNQGKTYALCTLGQIYYGGVGPIPASPETCTSYFQRAADLGDTEAMLTLAHYYQIGFGVPQSNERYMELNKLAADAGNPKGNYNLGVSYEFGKYSPVDEIESVKQYEIAAHGGIPEAQHNLGARYFNGKGVQRDTSKGLYFYLYAAASGSYLSQHNLGLAYLSGDGVDKNEVSALSWFLMAVDHGSKESQPYVETLLHKLNTEEISRARDLSKNFPDRWRAALERSTDENVEK